jgi:hypothetical protein
MRILVTQKGEEIIDQLERMNSTTSNRIHKLTNKNRNFSHSNFQKIKNMKIKSRNLSKNSLNNIYSKDSLKSKKVNSIHFLTEDKNSPTLNNTKRHHLSMKKIYFPKYFVEKYESPSKSTVSIIKQTNNILPSLKQNLSSDSKEEDEKINDNRLFSFKDIIPMKTIYNIKNNIVKKSIEKERNIKIDSSNFRSIYQLKSPIDKFNDLINQPILDSGNYGLIRYFNEKKNTSPLSIKEIVNSNPLRLNKVNKICECIFRDEEKQKSSQEQIEKKIKQRNNNEKLIFSKGIKNAKFNIEEIKGKLDKYNKRIDPKQRYKEIFKELNLKYWNKYDFDKLNKKKMKNIKSKNLNSLLEEEPSQTTTSEI